MQEVLAKLLAAAQAAGGKIVYGDFYESLSYQEQQLLPRAIRLGKQNKQLKAYIQWDGEAKTNTHILELITP